MIKGLLALIAVVGLARMSCGEAAAQKGTAPAILAGPLAKLDIKPAQIDTARGTPKGTLTVAMHFALDPGWLDVLEHSYAVTQQMYDYLVHDAMIKPMPYGYVTYGLAEQAELAADFRRAAFRLRPGLKFHDGQPVAAAVEDYWRRSPASKAIVVKGVRDLTARMAGLQTGELDLAFGMTGKLMPRLMADANLRWDPNFTGPWWLIFPGYNESGNPFRDKRVRQAISLAINRSFLVKQETQGIGKPWGNWISPENRDALQGAEAPVPEYNVEKAKQLMAQAGVPDGFEFEYVPFPPYFDMG